MVSGERMSLHRRFEPGGSPGQGRFQEAAAREIEQRQRSPYLQGFELLFQQLLLIELRIVAAAIEQ
jgi:hypothetical protein